MTNELIAILGVGVALAGLIMPSLRGLRQEVNGLSARMGSLEQRMAHLEGLLEGLREAITRSHVNE